MPKMFRDLDRNGERKAAESHGRSLGNVSWRRRGSCGRRDLLDYIPDRQINASPFYWPVRGRSRGCCCWCFDHLRGLRNTINRPCQEMMLAKITWDHP